MRDAAPLHLTGADMAALRGAGGPVFRRVVAEVAIATRVPPAAILGGSRRREVVQARDAVVALLRRAGWSSPMIGRVLGRDHSSVLTAARRHAARVAAVRAQAGGGRP